ncbi:hypothetical protein ACI797_05645 [Geodermatophilus sp. SYSU D00691]
MTDSALPTLADVRRPGGLDRRRLWRRWLVAVFLGETLGFLVPVLAVVVGADGWPDGARLVALAVAGAGEGAVLGVAQARVLTRVVPGFRPGAWTARTAVAAALAWVLGMAPSTLGGIWADWPLALQVALAVPAAAVLLLCIGVAQWTVLRPLVPHAGRWIGWTALAWLAGLAVFMLVATPLWQPGQPVGLTAAVGALAGGLMALAMAAVTGWGLVRLLAAARPSADGSGRRSGTFVADGGNRTLDPEPIRPPST